MLKTLLMLGLFNYLETYYNENGVCTLEKVYNHSGLVQSPSYFDAANGNALEWDQNSAGYLNAWQWVNNWNGARPDSYYDRNKVLCH